MKHVRFRQLIILLLLPCQTISADQPVFNLDIWSTSGQTKWRHDASYLNSRLGVPSSELDYQKIDSNILEFKMTETLPNGNGISIAIGAGLIEGGLLIDDDYLSAEGATFYSASQSGNHRFSRTHSDIDNSDMYYFSGELSPQNLSSRNNRYEAQFNFSFHYWHEEYRAYGITQIECTTLTLCDPAGTSGYSGVNVITNKVTWFGLGAGIDFELNVINSLAYYLDFTFYPFMSLQNEDTHHLRTDLAQNPSISMTGYGTGFDFMTGIRLYYSDEASFHLGYRVWERDVKNQTITFHSASGGGTSATLLNFKTRRDGLIAGFSMMF